MPTYHLLNLKSAVTVIHVSQVKTPAHLVSCFIIEKKNVLGLGVTRVVASFALNLNTRHLLVCGPNFQLGHGGKK